MDQSAKPYGFQSQTPKENTPPIDIQSRSTKTFRSKPDDLSSLQVKDLMNLSFGDAIGVMMKLSNLESNPDKLNDKWDNQQRNRNQGHQIDQRPHNQQQRDQKPYHKQTGDTRKENVPPRSFEPRPNNYWNEERRNHKKTN